MTRVKFSGVPVTLADGVQYIAPPLNFKQLRELKPRLQAMQKRVAAAGNAAIPSDEDMDDMLGIIGDSLSRNYPELIGDTLAELIDTDNVKEVTMAIMGQSGMQRVFELPKDEQSGEAQAGS